MSFRLIATRRILLAVSFGFFWLASGGQALAKNYYPDTPDSVQVFVDEAVPPDTRARSWAATPLANLRRYVKPRQHAGKTASRSRRAAAAQPSFARDPAMPVDDAHDVAVDATEMDAASRINAVRAGMEETIRARVIEKMNEGRRQPVEDAAPSQPDFGGGIPLTPTILPPGHKGGTGSGASSKTTASLAAPVLPGARGANRPLSLVTEKCVNKVTAWTRSCIDMGYPEDFGGDVRGETRIICAAGESRDIWLSNSCAPRQPVPQEKLAMAEADVREAPPEKTPVSLARAEKAVPPPEPEQVPEPKTAAVAGEEGGTAAGAKNVARPAVETFGAELPGAVPSIPVDSTPLIPAVISSGAKDAVIGSMCGTATDSAAVAAPTSGLCFRGTPGKVSGSGPWRWTCSDGGGRVEKCVTRMPLLAECGPMDSQKLKEVPMHGLCNSGSPSPVRGDGPWHWTCDGGTGGTRVMCYAEPEALQPVATPKAEPDLAAHAAPAQPAKSSKKIAKAKREVKKQTAVEAVAPAQAAGIIPQSIDGVCGNAVVTPLAAKPDRDLCHAGVAEQLKGTGPWTWVCRGSGTGLNVTCVAEAQVQGRLPSAIDGLCGSAAKTETSVMPAKDLCAAGLAGQVSGSGPWAWSCGGINGGMAATCFTQTTVQSRVPALAPQAPDDLPAPPPMEEVPPYERSSGSNNIGPGADDYMPAPPVRSPVQEKSGRRGVSVVDSEHASIRFDSGSETVRTDNMPVIIALGQRLGENPGAHVTVTAYADLQAVGNDAREARRLSLTRALAVRDILIINGASDGQIKIRAQGANVPKGNPDRVDFTDR